MTTAEPRARTAVLVAFATQGFGFISLTTRLPLFQHVWHASELLLSLMLLALVLAAGVGSLVSERLASRVGSGLLLRIGLLAEAVGIFGIVLTPDRWPAMATAVVFGAGVGMVDAAANMQAVTLEHASGRPMLPSFFGAWTIGGILGSGLALATASLPLSLTAAVAVVPVVAATAPYLAHADDLPGEADEELVANSVGWRPIVMVGLALMVFYLSDTAASTWGPAFLHNAVDAPTRLVALATFPYLIAQLAVRGFGDGLAARFGSVICLRWGTVLAAGALALIVAAPNWPAAVLGFTLLGAGTAMVAPLSFSAAARIAGAAHTEAAARRRIVDAVIARFNQFNYGGALLGSVVTGLVGAGNLRIGFAVPAVLIFALWPLARYFEA